MGQRNISLVNFLFLIFSCGYITTEFIGSTADDAIKGGIEVERNKIINQKSFPCVVQLSYFIHWFSLRNRSRDILRRKIEFMPPKLAES